MSISSFYSNGKLLLTGEYIVLDGAKALAIPTKYGQSLTVKVIYEPAIKWKSLNDKNEVWFENSFLYDKNSIKLTSKNSDVISKRLLQVINAALNINPVFLAEKLTENKGVLVTSKLDFPRDWGLGSSSTLLNNIANWATIDAFKLSKATFGGSGYDIACAQNNTPIIYTLTEEKRLVNPVIFNPTFKSQLFFVYLNKKQNSRASIETYQNTKNNSNNIIEKINEITAALVKTTSLEHFETLMLKHETLIGNMTNQTPVKKRLFNDYKNAIKSLGGWGGDFILVTGNEAYVRSYFTKKGFETILTYNEMAL